jgi:hypothetical protein
MYSKAVRSFDVTVYLKWCREEKKQSSDGCGNEFKCATLSHIVCHYLKISHDQSIKPVDHCLFFVFFLIE